MSRLAEAVSCGFHWEIQDLQPTRYNFSKLYAPAQELQVRFGCKFMCFLISGVCFGSSPDNSLIFAPLAAVSILECTRSGVFKTAMLNNG